MEMTLLIQVFGTKAEIAEFFGVTPQAVGKWDRLPELHEFRFRRDHPFFAKALDMLAKQVA